MLRVLKGKNLSPILANRLHIAHSSRYRFDRELEYSSSANKISSLSPESLTEMIVQVILKTVMSRWIPENWPVFIVIRFNLSAKAFFREPPSRTRAHSGQSCYFSPTTME